jgi:hypothetical protein
MKRTTTLTGLALATALALTGCGSTDAGSDPQSSSIPAAPAASTGEATTSAAASPSTDDATSTAGMTHGGMEHNPHGGPAPEGIEPAADPTYPVGTTVTLTADHMPGMHGAQATVTGAFDTTAYAVTYTPTTGGEPVENHKWVVHEELEDPGQAPLEIGTEVVLEADHMTGMDEATATIESSSDETVYMVDTEVDGMQMTNHKWVVESEIDPAP